MLWLVYVCIARAFIASEACDIDIPVFVFILRLRVYANIVVPVNVGTHIVTTCVFVEA